ncbi:hypothetical protein M5K25_021341 [Dendrobium thyrsiflorum]|uniref:Uncharacterized protein n=1 Tax=Dendrobium thyrsiflorum TaxID=117978 RepID=A0ABD0UC61_DENTH
MNAHSMVFMKFRKRKESGHDNPSHEQKPIMISSVELRQMRRRKEIPCDFMASIKEDSVRAFEMVKEEEIYHLTLKADGRGMDAGPDQDPMVPSSRVIMVPGLLSQRRWSTQPDRRILVSSHGLLPMLPYRPGIKATKVKNQRASIAFFGLIISVPSSQISIDFFFRSSLLGPNSPLSAPSSSSTTALEDRSHESEKSACQHRLLRPYHQRAIISNKF